MPGETRQDMRFRVSVACLERRIELKPKARITSGIIAAALGLTATFSPAGHPFSLLGNSASAQQPVLPAAAVSPVSDPYQVSAQKLHLARKAVATKDIATAERLTAEVEQMRLTYRATDERPEQIRTLVQQSKYLADFGRNTENSEQFRRSYAVFSLQQADTMLRRGELELATQLTQEAAAQRVAFSQSDVQLGLEPQTMFKRVDDARRVQNSSITVSAVPVNQGLSQAAQQHLNQSLAILQQARTALNAGDLNRAEQLSRVAMGYNLAESLYPAGSDTPNKLLTEIAARRQPIPQNLPAVYHPAPNPAYSVQQVRDNGQPLVASNAPLVDAAMQQRQALVSQISSEIMQQIADAQKISREQRNPDAGLEILQNAKIKVQQSQLDAATKDAFIRNIDRAIADTVKFNEQYQSQFDLAKQNQAVLEDRRREAEELRNKEERLKTLFAECNKLIDEQRYEEAVMLAKKAKEFAPDEPATNMLLTTTQLAWNAYRSAAVRDDKAEAFVNAMLGVDNASVMPNFEKSPIHYIDNWKGLTERRRSSDDVLKFRRPESELEILRKLEMPVSINIDKPIPLEQLLKILSGQTGVDIIVDWNALREVDITTDRLVSIQIMKEIKLKSVLNLILDQMNLAYVVKNEMLNITSASKAKGALYEHTYYVGDLINRSSKVDGGNRFDMRDAINRSIQQQSGRAVSRGTALSPLASNNSADTNNMVASSQQGNSGLLAQNFGALNLGGSGQQGGQSGLTGMNNGLGIPQPGAEGGSMADFGEIMDLIEAVISPDSWQAGGGEGEMMEYYPNLSLVIRQTEEVHAEIVDLLAQLRKLNDLQ
ncbi:MAG: hypothetical protein LBN39_06445, partial [Planctomycetaceae bacterium]|nr:hypothetical protein [Planctomycetaceae bacterium]